jgi:chorismate synthase
MRLGRCRMRYLTAGESHGPGLTVILEGCPAGLRLAPEDLRWDLQRRQRGAGRGARQKIERDEVRVLGGLRGGETLGSPLAFHIPNLDFENWAPFLDPWEPPAPGREMTLPRPGHADLAGCLKYRFDDARQVLERASARETAARVAAGAVARRLLWECGITVVSCVTALGGVESPPPGDLRGFALLDPELPMADGKAAERARRALREAAKAGDSLGGRARVEAHGVPPGLGSHVHWDRRLDARLAFHLMSIPSVKAVEVGEGVAASGKRGSEVHDPILPREGGGFLRPTNRAGGVEGGITNGEPVVASVYFKPLATLMRPLESVDLRTGLPGKASKERSDVTAVVPGAVVAEAAVALCLADALLEKFGGDSMSDLTAAVAAWRKSMPGGR